LWAMGNAYIEWYYIQNDKHRIQIGILCRAHTLQANQHIQGEKNLANKKNWEKFSP
jgi:hypothetical protein